ncbi:hypothetical protein PMCN03_1496 [Pasteurella multocida subsp. multocida str. HB03]|nr:hypothetical protein PMCN03_1496 [Pasteurella multocida subsp. multocida str. HB03]ESQ72783.1 hypothetical protein P1062_0204405 [Pasteurella multocida subsp. multocida P1062]
MVLFYCLKMLIEREGEAKSLQLFTLATALLTQFLQPRN